jgi:hypothetical protein
MKMRYKVTKNYGIDGPPIDNNEPVLVIRAQDVLAPFIMLTYIEKYKELQGYDDLVVKELREHLSEIIKWQLYNPVKVADR